MEVVVQPHERECAVCTNDFTTPKILPCGHLLCRQCVISWMDSKSDAGCPLCTCPIVEHQGNSSQSSADVIDALPTDSVMEAIVESSRVLGKDDMCTVCDDVRAEYICMQCLEKMCPSCTKIHKKMLATRSHEVESVSTVTPERLAASRPALCADHGDKQAEAFCADHHLSICASCTSIKHRTCLVVRDINDEMKAAENALCGLTDQLVQAEYSLKQGTEQLAIRLQKVEDMEQEDMTQVDKTCDKLQIMVENCRKELKKMIHDSSLQVKNSLLEVKRELDKRLGKVTSHRNIVTRARAVAPRAGLIHVTQALTDRVNSLHLNADVDELSLMTPPEISVECYNELEKAIENKLHQFQQQQQQQQQQTKPKDQQRQEANTLLTEKIANTRVDLSETGLYLQLDAQPPVLVFHENCGNSIRLTNGNRTAEKINRLFFSNAMVVSRDAMVPNVLYEVRVDAVSLNNNELSLGVTRTSPAYLHLTEEHRDLEDSVFVSYSGIYYYGQHVRTRLDKVLRRLKVGSRVGLLVDSSNYLHVYIDGQDKGVVPKRVTPPCFAVFDMSSSVTKVTALPTSRMT
ncbi:transcription intermediary factor 1-alpha-like isoform X2 [Pomacea canaliculata]|uniref:transcription intermediary factor 1-alpha-like isoform X2 n=1 Tax=Pomacea canaliculata TaxID=400727 RepID=UPI000D7347F7|nr:transcription intermediary factor 1-alpha-like isoform X2 [Pomacea canaliculata]